MSQIFKPLLDFFYPPHCIVCGKAGTLVHKACRSNLSYLSPPLCSSCGYPLPHEGAICSSVLCSLHPENRYVDKVGAVFRHEGGAREAVLKLKYAGVRVMREWLTEELAIWARQHGFEKADAVIGVPLHAHRLSERGYNQAGVLAQGLAERLQLPLGADWVVRARATRSQVGLNGLERAANVQGAFTWHTSLLKNHTILLVDDVCTTGATLNACAATLKQAGAGQVWGLTVTREVAASVE